MHQKHFYLQPLANVDRPNVSTNSTLKKECSRAFSHNDPESGEVRDYHDELNGAEYDQSSYQHTPSEYRFISPENLTEIPRFSKNEVIEGLTLGKGGCGTIKAVEGFSLNAPRKEGQIKTMHAEERESRKCIARHSHRSNGDARYAIKKLQRNTVDNIVTYKQAISDLANETMFLESIAHSHIIKLRGVANEDMMSNDFFLILDRLYDTLATRRVKWKRDEKQFFGLKRIFRNKDLLASRLNHASNLSSALKYLHRRGCLHRDLKPGNIGFDLRGDIKIFDFGLARKLPKKSNASDSTFHLTKLVGTPRYMAPEVVSGRYNESCDVYSLGLILWEIIVLKRPFKNHQFKDQQSLENFAKSVWSPDGPQYRPPVPKRVSPGLRQILKRSWDNSLEERPSAMEFENILRFETSRLQH